MNWTFVEYPFYIFAFGASPEGGRSADQGLAAHGPASRPADIFFSVRADISDVWRSRHVGCVTKQK